MTPPIDETFKPGETMTEVLSASEIKPGDVIRIWCDSLPYTFGEAGWLPKWWWCKVTQVTPKGMRLRDLKSGNEDERSFADSVNNPYGIHSYKHPGAERF